MSTATGLTRRQREANAEERMLSQVSPRRSGLLKAIVNERTARIPLRQIVPNPQQPRKIFEPAAIEELGMSIRLHGLQQHVVLEQPDDGRDEYILLMGERRLRAHEWLSQQAPGPGFDPVDFEQIMATIRQVRTDNPERTRLVLALIENLVREDLSEREAAAAFKQLKQQAGWTWDEVARHLGIDKARVQKVASLDGHEDVLGALERKEITQNQAITLVRIPEAEVRAHLIPHAAELSEEATSRVSQRVRELDPGLPAQERAKEALEGVRGRPVVGPRPPSQITRSHPHRHGTDVEMIREDLVVPGRLPLAKLMRMREVHREAFAQALQATCEELNIWPQRPKSAKRSTAGGRSRSG